MKKINIKKSGMVRPLIVTLLSLIILNISFNGVSILSLFSPLEGHTDFQLSDLYTKVADKRPVSKCSDRVIVMSTDDCSREEIVAMVDILRDFSPAAIGVDINFRYPTDDDRHMISVFDDCDNIVLPLIISSEYDENSFLTGLLPFDKFAAVNMERFSTWGPIRSFRPMFSTAEGTVPGFPVRLAALADPYQTEKFLKRGKESEFINFHSCTFEILTFEDLFDKKASEKIADKVVLLGDLKNSKDVFPVPHKDIMPGVMIHAYSVETILSGTLVDSMNMWLNLVISTVLCFLFAFLHIVLERYFDDGVDFTVRMIQIVMMFFLYWLGCMLFVHENYYVDMSTALLMIVISAFSTDVCAGIEHMYTYMKNTFKK